MMKDKMKHALVGLGISLVVSPVALAFGETPFWGFTLAAGVGSAKEIYDRFTPGREEFHDFLATAAGGLLPSLVVWAWL